jgi:hypothetical protein
MRFAICNWVIGLGFNFCDFLCLWVMGMVMGFV